MKHQLFNAVQNLEQASTAKAAVRAIRSIQSATQSLRSTANQLDPTPHSNYVFGSWTEEFFAGLMEMVQHGNVIGAYEHLQTSKTMRILLREKQAMTDTYEDYKPNDKPQRRGVLPRLKPYAISVLLSLGIFGFGYMTSQQIGLQELSIFNWPTLLVSAVFGLAYKLTPSRYIQAIGTSPREALRVFLRAA